MKHWIKITDKTLEINGERQQVEKTGEALLNELYHSRIGDYPKYHKMDTLCKLGFVASELLLRAEAEALGNDGSKPENRVGYGSDSRAILLFNRNGSLNADRNYQATIQEASNYYPSPALFVYTLPNIVTGEIAIRNRYYGETNFIVLPYKEAEAMDEQVRTAFCDPVTQSVLTGWVDCFAPFCFEARIGIIHKENVTLQNIYTLLT